MNVTAESLKDRLRRTNTDVEISDEANMTLLTEVSNHIERKTADCLDEQLCRLVNTNSSAGSPPTQGQNEEETSTDFTAKDQDEEDESSVLKKKLRLDDESGSPVRCQYDIISVVNRVLAGIDVSKIWERKVEELYERLGYLHDIEQSIAEIDKLFDKVEEDLNRGFVLEEESDANANNSDGSTNINRPNVPEVHFIDIHEGLASVVKPTDLQKPLLPYLKSGHDMSNDVITVGKYRPKLPHLPPVGPIERKPIKLNSIVYAAPNNPLGVWSKAKVVCVACKRDKREYIIKFTNKQNPQKKAYSLKQLAYISSPKVMLPVGTRVSAFYRDETWSDKPALYAGIIAEPPKLLNNFRYLIFFDDGYAQYVAINEVYLVCESSKQVWEDVHPYTRQFIKDYLEKYPERPMLRLQKGQRVKTEWEGKWSFAEVMNVDASMVKLCFEHESRYEWLYRGSTRFFILYEAMTKTDNRQGRRHNLVPAGRKQQPFVEYTRSLDDPTRGGSIAGLGELDEESEEKKTESSDRSVACKSTTQEKKNFAVRHHRNKLSQAGLRRMLPIQMNQAVTKSYYESHKCSPQCISIPDDPEMHKGKNPLLIPCLVGWRRQIAIQSKGKKHVFYIGPCGRRMRSPWEVLLYLSLTKSLLGIDMFCFDPEVQVFYQFVPAEGKSYIKDITYGKEPVSVSCINNIDRSFPPYVEYSHKRFASEGVVLDLDSNFLCGCDCEDDCQDREKCQCQQLTISATEALLSGKIPDAGYEYKRLMEPLITGIFECNQWCKCSSRCMNRVAQNGLQVRLQIFKTEDKGWGIRCLDDLPQGHFICIYAGQLLTEQGANEDGNQYGDEYLAELDHIEVVENQKEGYESDVVEPESTPQEEKEEDEVEETCNILLYSSSSRDNSSDSDFESEISDKVRPARSYSRNRGKGRYSDDDDYIPSHLLDQSSSKVKAEEWLKSTRSTANSEDSVSNDSSLQSWFVSRKLNRLKARLTKECQVVLCRLSEDVVDQYFKKPSKDHELSSSSSSSETEEHTEVFTETKSSDSRSEPSSDVKQHETKSSLSKKEETLNYLQSVNKFASTRHFFGEEDCYIMDAQNCGNIGRYLNHSCDPNVFVQNVFVDSHDLRFPWVAFFASRFIEAGSELTWDYNYDVGSVPGKVMYCMCGSTDCRGRLL